MESPVKTIGIIGNGVVGSATAAAWRGWRNVDVRVWDAKLERSTHNLPVTLDSDIIFICLPETVVEAFLQDRRNGAFQNSNFVIRSTVPVGFTQRMRDELRLPNLVHSPEFLTARTAEHDAANPTRNIIGSEYGEKDYHPSMPQNCTTVLYQIYEQRFDAPIFVIKSDQSEFTKLMTNAHSAVKVALFNEFASFAEARGLDWQTCLDLFLMSGWVNPMHTQVPGPDGKRGFGGTCLPKDLKQLIECFAQFGLRSLVMQAADYRNQFDRVK